MNLKNLEKEHLKFLKSQSIEHKIETTKKNESLRKIDTIIVSAHDDGFRNVFLDKNCWYSVNLNNNIIKKLKYIAIYQTSPISAITYYAKIFRIELYENTGKYIIYFKGKPIKLKTIKLDKDKGHLAPQGTKYTNFKKLKCAKKYSDLL